MQGLDTNAIDLAVEMLDAEDEALVKYTKQMEKAGNLADERLQRITSIVNEYSAEESHYQRCSIQPTTLPALTSAAARNSYTRETTWSLQIPILE